MNLSQNLVLKAKLSFHPLDERVAFRKAGVELRHVLGIGDRIPAGNVAIDHFAQGIEIDRAGCLGALVTCDVRDLKFHVFVVFRQKKAGPEGPAKPAPFGVVAAREEEIIGATRRGSAAGRTRPVRRLSARLDRCGGCSCGFRCVNVVEGNLNASDGRNVYQFTSHPWWNVTAKLVLRHTALSHTKGFSECVL